MSIADGTPRVGDKIRTLIEALLGKVPPADQPVLTGEIADAHKALDFIDSIFGPVIQNVEQGALQIATTAARGILTAIPNVTSLQQAVDIVMAAFEAESGPLADFLKSIGQQAFATLVSAILTGLGKVVPVSPRA